MKKTQSNIILTKCIKNISSQLISSNIHILIFHTEHMFICLENKAFLSHLFFLKRCEMNVWKESFVANACKHVSLI